MYKFKIFHNNIPDNIRNIEVNSYKFYEIPDKYPDCLVSLNITHTKIILGQVHFANILNLEYLHLIKNDILYGLKRLNLK